MTALDNTPHPRSNLVALAVAAALAVCGSRQKVEAAQLPVPCGGTACGPSVPTWLTAGSGNATLAQGGNTLTVNQTTSSVALNWQSFNISADGKVNFVQPSSTAIAINRIFQGSVSQIFGALNANGTVYLLNQNGLLFGSGSVVNVGGLLASSLDLTGAARERGIAGAAGQGTAPPGPALAPWDGTEGVSETINVGSVSVAPGASITSNQGQILLFAPTVTNSGTLASPGGQTILGAGQTIYLAAQGDDPNIRGLFVEVAGCKGLNECGTVSNTGGSGQPIGQIIANAGNVTLAGLAVQQEGRISATTTVRANGSIRLQARETDSSVGQTANFVPPPTESGTLTLGAGSVTAISLEGGPNDKTVDVNAQPKSDINLIGGEIDLLSNAAVTAPSGTVTLTAISDPNPKTTLPPTQVGGQPDTSRIYLAPSSSIDVSGATVAEPAADNSLAVQLRGSETENFPATRAGPLRGQTVYVDIRQHGTYSDGSAWVGTPLADLSGDVSAIQRDVFERNLTGGSINFSAGGSVIVSPGATLNVSGGQIDWQAGYVKTSVLVAPNGQLTPISQANSNVSYLGTLDTVSQGDPHWGTVANVTLPGYSPLGVYQPAYVEGKDAGSVAIAAAAFVLDGTVSAGAVTGPLQRVPTDPQFGNPNFPNYPYYYPGMMYRFSDQVPLGGMLTLGNPGLVTTGGQRALLDNFTFSSAPVLPTLTGADGSAFDPQHDALPADFTSSVRPDLFGADNLTRLNVYADGIILVPAGVSLTPGPGGSISLTGGNVHMAGSIVSNGGTVTLESTPTVLFGGQVGGGQAGSPDTSLVLDPTAVIDLRGAWVNDTGANSPTSFAPLYTNGGTATIESAEGGLLSIASGARIDVSAGAQLTASHNVVAGNGGSITVAALPPPGLDNLSRVDLPADLSANLAGYAIANGGTLSLTLPGLCVSSVACADATAYRVDPDVLTNLGFGAVTLAARPSEALAAGSSAASVLPTATTDALVVAPDVDVLVRQRNYSLLTAAFNAPSAGSLAGLVQVVTLPAYMRHPEALNLAATAPSLDQPQFADLAISPGAVLEFDPGARVSLASNSRILMNGAVNAAGGSVALTVAGGLVSSGALVPSQAIWLGSGSVIDVQGTTVTSPNTSGLLLGNVLGGGNITVDAKSGYIVGLPGSQILAGGASGTLDLHAPGTDVYTRQTVASSGGSISLLASQGIQYDGLIAAPAGGPGVSGGSLSVAVDANQGQKLSQLAGATLMVPRVVTVTATDLPTVVGEGSSIPSFLNGLGRISAQQINAGGFDNVTLTARDLVVDDSQGQPLPVIYGAVAFDGGVALQPSQSLIVDSSQIAAVGSGAVRLTSAYVRLGSTDTLTQGVYVGATEGTASLSVKANLIDLVGTSTLNGFGPAVLSSSGDIRLSGVQVTSGSVLAGFTGAFESPGPLTLTAQQIYPTTLSDFTVQLTSTDATQSVLTIGRAPGTPSEVLSAAGNLTLGATQIIDSGVVKAPIGTLSLQGQSVSLESGAVLSVSAAGTTIPFGQTQGGTDWVYALNPGNATTVYGTNTGDTAVPGKQITVTADNFQFQSGATIDIAGGGDLLAYEWTAGLGGTRDVLSPTQSPGLYAVLPGASLPYAPIDPNEDRGFTSPVGSSVHLSGGAGLAAGTYALLPARYALLPGAYLVKAVSGYTDLGAGQTIAQLDGSTIVSGYRVNAATGQRDARTSGFDIVSGAYALDSTQSNYTLAQYSVTSADAFFASQATTNNVTTPRLPADAGSLAINVTGSAQLQGMLAATAQSGYRGGNVDITAPDLFVTGKPADAPAGTVVLDANQLNQLGAESLLLGATRSSSGNYTQLNVAESGSGSSVEIDTDTTLQAPEVILVASNTVQLDAGASVTAVGGVSGAEPDLVAPTGTAVLRLSSGAQVSLNPAAAMQAIGTPPVGLPGSIKVAAGASISAPGAVSVDAGGAVDFAGGLSAAGAAVRLGGQQLALGAAPAVFPGFAIGSNLLSGLSGADLTLQVSDPTSSDYGTREIQVYGPVQLSLNSLAVDAPGITAATADGSLTVSAQNVTLGSGAAQAYTQGSASGTASLSINAAHVSLADGTFATAGYGTTSIAANQAFTITGNGTLGVSGALDISSPVIQSAAGKTYQIIADGGLVTAAPSGAPATPTSVAGPGGAINFTGSAVTLGGNIVLPGGRIVASATNGELNVASGAVLDVSGFSENFDGEVRSADGGTVSLSASSSVTGVASNITVYSGSLLDVSAGSGAGAGGTLSLAAPTGTVTLSGTVRGAGAAGSLGGSLSVAAQQLDFAGLVAEAGSAGFTKAVSLRQRGSGGFELTVGTQLQAQDVELTADQGAITIDNGAAINASAAAGGRIVLTGQSIDVEGSLLAGATGSSDRGGTVELLSSGALMLGPGSTIGVGGTGGGTTAAATGIVWLRAPEQTSNGTLPEVQIAQQASISGAKSITLEGYSYASPDLAPGSPSTGSVSLDLSTVAGPGSAWYSSAQALVANASQIETQLHESGNAAFSVLPGLEIDTQGDLHIGTAQGNNWDFSPVRFDDSTGNLTVPGVLTVRAGGNLYVDNSISDGFAGMSSVLGTTPSWSYRLTAGADLGSANPLAVVANSSAGSIIVAPGTPPPAAAGDAQHPGQPVLIRTGTGSIDLAAAGDLQLGNQASVIYTAGAVGPGQTFGVSSRDGPLYVGLKLPQDGGDITVTVGRDIIGAPSSQLFNDWLFRSGRNASQPNAFQPTAWAPDYAFFEQGIGALGGGDLTIVAGRDIHDLGAVVPSTGVPVGTAASAQTVEQNAGTLTVQSGGDILGGKFLDMAGDAVVTAGGAIRTGTPQALGNAGMGGLNLILGLGSGTFDVAARSDLMFEAGFEVTLLPRASTQFAAHAAANYTIFGTYTDASRLTLQSTGGTVSYTNRSDAITDSAPSMQLLNRDPDTALALEVLPPSFAAVALGGDITVGQPGSPDRNLALWPGPQGNIDLLALGSIKLTNTSITMSDADPASFPTVNAVSAINGELKLLDAQQVANNVAPGLHAAQPLHSGVFAADGQPDAAPIRMVALTGDFTQSTSATSIPYFINVPKPIDIAAGGNIVNLQLDIQQFAESNVSSVTAGGNISYPFARDPDGNLVPNNSAINVAGPGQLEVQAGGTINLGTSAGISSLGNLGNSALPAGGASINVAAGITQPPDYQDFTDAYLVNDSVYDQALEQYVTELTGQQNFTKSDALAAFEGLTIAQQTPLLDTILFDELRAGGRSAAASGPGHDNYTRAFTALTTLFPDAANDRSKGQAVPYSGDILLYFSRIYTLAGGGINLLAPGGQVNVGLAAAPTSFGVNKGAAQLGIVAQSTGSDNVLAYSDIQVNQSRVFAADGGDILMWSTFGNIDAGRGAKTAISAPPPVITIDSSGHLTLSFPAALTGSGIQAISTTAGIPPGAVDLFAPNGVVNANDAGIVAGNLTIAATAVLGSNNITVSGTAVGLPPPAIALGAVTAGASSSSSAASSTATENAGQSGNSNSDKTPKTQDTLHWLDVFVLGLGEGDCKPDDLECIKKQQKP